MKFSNFFEKMLEVAFAIAEITLPIISIFAMTQGQYELAEIALLFSILLEVGDKKDAKYPRNDE